MKRQLLVAIVLGVLLHSAVHSQEEKIAPKTGGFKALGYFAGAWKTDVTDKPSKWLPDGRKHQVQENIAWVLKDRFILAREISSAGIKSLWLMTYDPKAKSYPFWYFNNKDVLGGEWSCTWDEDKRTLTAKATD